MANGVEASIAAVGAQGGRASAYDFRVLPAARSSRTKLSAETRKSFGVEASMSVRVRLAVSSKSLGIEGCVGEIVCGQIVLISKRIQVGHRRTGDDVGVIGNAPRRRRIRDQRARSKREEDAASEPLRIARSTSVNRHSE